MKRILIILLSVCILSAFPFISFTAPESSIIEQGDTLDGGTIYFIYANIIDKSDIYDAFNLTYVKGDYFSELSLTQLKPDLQEQWENHISTQNIKRNTLFYSTPRQPVASSIVSEEYSISQAVLYAGSRLLNTKNIEILSTSYLDNRTALSNSISIEDGHMDYDIESNTLLLNYTYKIDEYTKMIDNVEYLVKKYEFVKYKIVCISVDLKLTQPPPTETTTPTPTPSATISPSPSTSTTVTPSIVPTQTQSETPDIYTDSQPQVTPSVEPSKEPSPISKPEIPKRNNDRYKDIWTYVILQTLTVLIVLIIFLSRRKKH